MIETNRRTLITGLISFIAAPAVVRATSLMPVRAIEMFPPRMVVGPVYYERLTLATIEELRRLIKINYFKDPNS